MNELVLPSEFKPTFEYSVVDGRMVNEKEINHDMLNATGVVYARVCNGRVLYIGRSDGKLRSRINLHRKYVNGENRDLIQKLECYRKCVEKMTVVIHAYKPDTTYVCGRIVHLHGSLEEALIKEFKPMFNGSRWLTAGVPTA